MTHPTQESLDEAARKALPMTNPKHTSSDLLDRLRGDWPEILVEKHWMMDSDAIDKQREEAADRIEALEAEVERLREALDRVYMEDRRIVEHWRQSLATGDSHLDERIVLGRYAEIARAALDARHD